MKVLTLLAAIVVGQATAASAVENHAADEQRAPFHQCDELAAHTFDPEKLGQGVEWEELDADAAITSCQEALESHPDELRFVYQLGRAYSKAEKFDLAIGLLRRAAEQGYAAAQYNLGVASDEGRGLLPQSYKEAIGWYAKAAEHGHAAAMFQLGTLYLGTGVAKDIVEAREWFSKLADELRKAAEQGSARDAYARRLCTILLEVSCESVEEQLERAIERSELLLAAEQGLATAQLDLGLTLEKEGKYRDAITWIRRAANQGNSEAQYELGQRYRKGTGVLKDLAQAYAWLNVSSANGYSAAGVDRDSLEELLSSEELVEARKLSKIYFEYREQ